MESSILQHYWNQQEKQRPLSLYSASARSNVLSANAKFDHRSNRSDIFSSQASFRTDFESNSRSVLSPSSTNITIKEFCPVEKEKEEEEEEEEKYSLKRFVHQ